MDSPNPTLLHRQEQEVSEGPAGRIRADNSLPLPVYPYSKKAVPRILMLIQKSAAARYFQSAPVRIAEIVEDSLCSA